MHARLLPYVEQANLANLADLDLSYSDPANVGVAAQRVDTYLCPSDVHDRQRIDDDDGTPIHYPLSYGYNGGTWMVWDTVRKRLGNGAFAPNGKFAPRDFTDGTSNTLGFSEVKAYTPYNRDGETGTATIPDFPAEVEGLIAAGGSNKPDSGHTEWVDGRVHQTGFTTALTPNSPVMVPGGVSEEGDYTSCREDKSCASPTYAAVTSRSWHEAIVNSLVMDGSVRSISESIDHGTWRDLGQRNDGRTIDDF